MKKIILLVVVLVSISACKKENVEVVCKEPSQNGGGPPAPFPSYKIPNTKGSYWIYEWYSIDTNGIESLYGDIDTITIIGDTIINGRKYVVKEGSYWVIPSYVDISRDSSGYIIDQYTNVIYSYTNFIDTLSAGYEPSYWSWYHKMYNEQQIIVPAGSFSTIENRRYLYDQLGGPITTCGDTTLTKSVWYAEGVGRIKETSGFYHSIKHCTNDPGANVEARLIEYYIAP